MLVEFVENVELHRIKGLELEFWLELEQELEFELEIELELVLQTTVQYYGA